MRSQMGLKDSLNEVIRLNTNDDSKKLQKYFIVSQKPLEFRQDIEDYVADYNLRNINDIEYPKLEITFHISEYVPDNAYYLVEDTLQQYINETFVSTMTPMGCSYLFKEWEKYDK